MGDHESDGLEYQDDEEEEEEDDEPVHDLTGGGALLSVQLSAATAAPRLHNAPRECAIRMPEARRPTLGRADLLRQPQAPGGLRRVSVTWRRCCLPRERHLATNL